MTAGNHRPAGSGDSGPASAAAPVSAPAREGAASADAPGADRPRHSPAEALALVIISAVPHVLVSGTSRLQSWVCERVGRPARRAGGAPLKTVEKVVTGVVT